MCQSLQTKEGQAWIPDFLKDTSGTTVTFPDKERAEPTAADVPLGTGLADQAKRSILTRRERIRRAVEGE